MIGRARRIAALLAISASVGGAACGGSNASPAHDGRPAPNVALAPWHSPPAPPTPDLPLLPGPRVLSTCEGAFVTNKDTPVVVGGGPEALAVGRRLAAWLGIEPSRVSELSRGSELPPRSIAIWIDRRTEQGAPRDPAQTFPSAVSEESFVVDVDASRVLLRASAPEGLYYAAQTLAQLAGSRSLEGGSLVAPHPIACLHLEDMPSKRVRAMHLDVARHFFPRAIVERYIDLLAFYRFNVFHWHLTDDQGFRLPLTSHPEIVAVGSRRIEEGTQTGGHYTEDDVRHVVAYAKERFITVIPEVEMPGHTRALLAARPDLSCTGKKLPVATTWGVFDEVLCPGNRATYKVLDDILGEVTSLFPSRFVHLGGDEVPKSQWQACPKCRALMKEEHLDAEGLQGLFLRRVSESLTKRGRRVLAWDESLDGGLPPSGIVVAWQSTERGALAAKAGHEVILAPNAFTYFDRAQYPKRTDIRESVLGWSDVLAFDPTPQGLSPEEAALVLGGEGALWTERVKTQEDLELRALPRMAALSEVLWRSSDAEPRRDKRAIDADFSRRFRAQRPMLDAGRVTYFVEPPSGLPSKKVFMDRAALRLAPPLLHSDGTVRFTLDGSEPNETSPAFASPIDIRETTRVTAQLFLPNGRRSDVVTGTFEKQLPSPAQARPALGLTSGVQAEYAEGAFDRIPDMTGLPKGTRRLRTDLPSLSFAESFRAEDFAVDYSAYIDVPDVGIYRFVARADDGVVVDIDGHRVVTDDGKHAPRDAEGEIALEPGLHSVRIGYFQGGHGRSLSLQCEGPKLPLGPCALLRPSASSSPPRQD